MIKKAMSNLSNHITKTQRIKTINTCFEKKKHTHSGINLILFASPQTKRKKANFTMQSSGKKQFHGPHPILFRDFQQMPILENQFTFFSFLSGSKKSGTSDIITSSLSIFELL